MATAGLTLYELAGADPDLRFSPHCWKTRMALAHKGLTAEGRPWRFHEKEAIAFSGQGLVPILVEGDLAVSDSWQIALHLETRFPERPSLFGAAAAVPLTRFINTWADSTLPPAFARVLVMDIYNCLYEGDRSYFRSSREQRFGMTLEEVVGDPPARLAELRRAFQPVRLLLKNQAYLAGEAPAYADYCVFGFFMWARCVSAVELLEADDPLVGWRDRLLDAFGGLARSAPTAFD